MLSLNDQARKTCVPDKYTYRFPQDGYTAEGMSVEEWFEAINKHYTDNNYAKPDNWKQIAEDQLCRRLSGEWCSGGNEYSFIDTRFTFDDFVRGAKVLGSFALGDGVVSQEVAEERALICSRCVVNVNVPGCSACKGMANLVAELKGSKMTKHDHLLKACGICLCPNSVQVWVPAEHLAKGVTKEMMKQYEQVDECWKYKAVSAIDNNE